ncbi:hypothetical protein AB0I81_63715, partial [Nonomuraea sp. NPDC050404]
MLICLMLPAVLSTHATAATAEPDPGRYEHEAAANAQLHEASASAAKNGPITRAEVLARGKTWVDAAVPYDNYTYRDGYRKDCSGFISFAWFADQSYTTNSLSQISGRIVKDELLPGDALLWQNPKWPNEMGHVRLFGGWLDGTHERYWVYEQTPPRARYYEYSWSATYPTYLPYRYNKIVNDGSGDRVVSGANADGRMEVFTGAADGVWHTYQTAVNGGWAPWEFWGGPKTANLAIATSADGRLELFALNRDTFWHRVQKQRNGSWWDWENNFGGGGYGLAVGTNQDGRLEVFASNPTGIHHRHNT